jgi:hypothetical protein
MGAAQDGETSDPMQTPPSGASKLGELISTTTDFTKVTNP